MKLTSNRAELMVDKIFKKAHELSLEVSVCIADSAGHMIAFRRADNAPLITIEVAQVKARTAVFLRTDTKNMPYLQPIAGPMAASVGYPLGLLPGGVAIFEGQELIGGIGVSGGPGEQDHFCAMAGISDE